MRRHLRSCIELVSNSWNMFGELQRFNRNRHTKTLFMCCVVLCVCVCFVRWGPATCGWVGLGWATGVAVWLGLWVAGCLLPLLGPLQNHCLFWDVGGNNVGHTRMIGRTWVCTKPCRLIVGEGQWLTENRAVLLSEEEQGLQTTLQFCCWRRTKVYKHACSFAGGGWGLGNV